MVINQRWHCGINMVRDSCTFDAIHLFQEMNMLNLIKLGKCRRILGERFTVLESNLMYSVAF